VTASTSTVTLADSYEDEQSPPTQALTLQVTGSGIAAVGLAFDPAYPEESWLGAEMTGAASPYQVSIGLAGPAPVGQHTAHLLAGAVDKDGNVLDSTPITVNYTVIARLHADVSSLAFTGVNGDAVPGPQSVAVQGTGLSWTAESGAAWLLVSPASGQGGGSIQVSIDPSSLASGHHATTVTVRSQDGQSIELPVTLDLSAPVFSVTPAQLSFGGAAGHAVDAQDLQLALGIDSQAHAWRIASMPSWLSADTSSGEVASGGQTIRFTPDFSQAPAGVTAGTVVFEVVVNGDTLQQQVPVTLRQDSHRLTASRYGVALTAVPGWSRLSANVTVKENFGRAVAWTATSDKSWLTVTGSGTTGGTLAMTANPAALATDSLEIATVRISSSDAKVSAGTVLKVGLWKGSSKLSATMTKSGTAYSELEADPVRPYAYVHQGGSTIDVYHVHTGAKVASIASAATAAGAMSASPDGRFLYVVDSGFKRIRVVDLALRKAVRTIDTVNPTPRGSTLKALVASGKEVLVLGDQSAYRASDGASLGSVGTWSGSYYGTDRIAATPDGSRLYYLNQGLSPSSAVSFALEYAELGGGALVATELGDHWDVGSNGGDIAVSPAGSTVYTASGSPYQFYTWKGDDLSAIGNLPGGDAYPNNVEVGSDGRIAGGISGWYSTSDIWLYKPDGAIQKTFKVAGYAKALMDAQLVFSGDALALVTLTDDPRLVFIPIGP
jgi:hypothetical protein